MKIKQIIIFSLSIIVLTLSPFSPCRSMDADPDAEKVVRILSIDGGGIRGLIPARLLQHWEEELEEEFKRKIPISECFDVIAGTSTGGIIALCLTYKEDDNSLTPKYAAREIRELYEKNGRKIFPPAEWELMKNFLKYFTSAYDPKPLENLLLSKFNNRHLNTVFSQVIIPAYEMHGNTPYIFNSLEAKNTPSKNFLIRDVARATSAAPTYLSAPKIIGPTGEKYAFLDGGIFANDPAWIGFQKARARFPKAKKYVVVSLGTGEVTPPNLYDQLEGAGQIAWAPYITTFMMNCNNNTTEDALTNIKSIYEGMGGSFEYIRIQPSLSETQQEMDNAKEDIIQGLIGIGRKYEQHSKTLQVTNLLKQYVVSQGYQSIKEIGNDHVQQLTLFVKARRNGTSLNLEGHDVTNEDLGLIQNLLKDNTTLTEINLSRNKLNSDVAKSLKGILMQTPRITRLILDNNNFGLKGTQPFMLLKGTKLTYLSLKYVQLGDKDVLPLISLVSEVDSLNIYIRGIDLKESKSSEMLRDWILSKRINLEDN